MASEDVNSKSMTKLSLKFAFSVPRVLPTGTQRVLMPRWQANGCVRNYATLFPPADHENNNITNLAFDLVSR